MGACDVFTLASQWEGLPVALMEALTLGLPVVATNVGGVGEEMHDGVDALLVPPRDPVALADAIECVVIDPLLHERLSAAASACWRLRRASRRRPDRGRVPRPGSRGRQSSRRSRHRRLPVDRCRRGSTSVRRRRTIGRRSSSCVGRRWVGVTIPASSSCSRGSTIRTRSARRTCGWPPMAIASWACEPSCGGSSCGVARCCTRFAQSTRRRTPTTRARACSPR